VPVLILLPGVIPEPETARFILSFLAAPDWCFSTWARTSASSRCWRPRRVGSSGEVHAFGRSRAHWHVEVNVEFNHLAQRQVERLRGVGRDEEVDFGFVQSRPYPPS